MEIEKELLSHDRPNGVLVITPSNKSQSQNLIRYIQQNKTVLEELNIKHGALLFRGFEVGSAQNFENISRELDEELKNNYLGTSPRNSITKYTFSASELPDFYPIPQHCEMSFLKYPPRKLFFYCHLAPLFNGETPVCDFRKVYNELRSDVRDAFEAKGIKTIRNYDGPESKGKFDLWKLKRWNEMFLSSDKTKVEESCRANGIDFEWMPGDKLRLINEQDAFIKHKITGEKVWFNHTQVFHRDAAALEYSHIAKRQKLFRSYFFSSITSLFTFAKRLIMKPSNLGTHTVFKDGTEIPREYVAHLEDVIWRNMQFFSWQKNDILSIDNFSTSHGRMPYKGPREIYVCWAANR